MQHEYVVQKAREADIGLGRARVHFLRRDSLPRFTICHLTVNNRCKLVSVLGHEGKMNEIDLDIDLRNFFGVQVDQKVNASLKKANLCNQLKWYLSVPDPTIRLPAWLAFWSVILGTLGLVLAVISLKK